MTKTILAAATLAAAVLMGLPAQAQSGGPGMPTPTPKSSTNPTAMGQTTTNSGPTAAAIQADTGSNNSATIDANADLRNQAQAPSMKRALKGDAAERRMTECLNNAMAQKQPIGSCRR